MKNPGYSSYINKWPLVCYLVLIRDDLVGRGPFLDDDTEVGAHGADRGRLAAPGRTGQQGDPRRLEDRKCMTATSRGKCLSGRECKSVGRTQKGKSKG